MKWWRRKKEEQRNWHPLIARRILVLEKQLRKFAGLLQQKTKALSPRKLKWMLVLFCALFISQSSYLIIVSLQSKRKDVFVLTPIQVPSLFKETLRQPVLTKAEVEKMHRFKIYLDSLNRTLNGKALRDSLLNKRPRLLDTIEVLEKLYVQQNKN